MWARSAARVAWACVALVAASGLAADAAPAFADESFLLALTWQPTFCSGSHASYVECRAAANTPPRLVLHGLWPDWDVNGDGKRNADDDFCVAAGEDRKAAVARDIAAGKSGNWLQLPKVPLSPASETDLASVMPGTAAGLERHEWMKHGTCSGLKVDDYFATAVLLLREVERGALAKLIVASAGESVERKALLAAFDKDFGANASRAVTLDCARTTGGSALLEVRIRLKRATVMQGLNAGDLDTTERPHGNCGASIEVPAAGA